MKKVILAVLVAIAIYVAPAASNNVVTSGDNLISVGLNIDNMFYEDISPGISVAWDHGVSFAESFTFGAQADLNFYDGGAWFSPSFRAGFHPFAMPALQGKVKIAPKFDPYVTIGTGTSMSFGDGDFNVDFFWRSAAGCYWMFNPKIGLWGEIGTDFIAGITFKL